MSANYDDYNELTFEHLKTRWSCWESESSSEEIADCLTESDGFDTAYLYWDAVKDLSSVLIQLQTYDPNEEIDFENPLSYC